MPQPPSRWFRSRSRAAWRRLECQRQQVAKRCATMDVVLDGALDGGAQGQEVSDARCVGRCRVRRYPPNAGRSDTVAKTGEMPCSAAIRSSLRAKVAEAARVSSRRALRSIRSDDAKAKERRAMSPPIERARRCKGSFLYFVSCRETASGRATERLLMGSGQRRPALGLPTPCEEEAGLDSQAGAPSRPGGARGGLDPLLRQSGDRYHHSRRCPPHLGELVSSE